MVAEANDVSPDWIAAAEAGVQYALKELNSTAEVRVVEIQGTIADTRSDTLFVASAIATFKLLGLTNYGESFSNEKWEVCKMNN